MQEYPYKTIAEFLGYSVNRSKIYFQLQEPDGRYYPAARLSETSAWYDIEHLFIEEGRIRLLRILRKDNKLWNEFFDNLLAVVSKRIGKVAEQNGLNSDRALLLTMAITEDLLEALYQVAIAEKLL